ncbi:alpha/beta hydrolase [Streptomyces sp. NPDC004539]|uniref:alpha/beta hydrolase n=1 Tax=Streptomyces sp. NPDC004539 TaxID=3154280 RepID=UPI0033A03AC2
MTALPTSPALDPEVAAALAAIPGPLLGDFTPEGIAAVRRGVAAASPTDEQLSQNGYFEVEDRPVPGPPGAPDITLLICRPRGATASRPVLYHAHGGGMMFGDRRSGLDTLLRSARELEAVVVSVEYRLAPEHPHPAPVEDVYAGLVWTSGNATGFGGDPHRIVLAGTSAGGGLAAATALLARDRQGPRPVAQLLLCPMLDDRDDSPSARETTDLATWNRAANKAGWTALLGDRRGSPDVPPYAAPSRADDLSGLPPAFLDVGSAEIFRDEVVAYASRIWQAGGDAELHVWPGGCHVFDEFAPQAAISRAALSARSDWLRRILAQAPSVSGR